MLTKSETIEDIVKIRGELQLAYPLVLELWNLIKREKKLLQIGTNSYHRPKANAKFCS